MQTFIADLPSQNNTSASCATCCCKPASLSAGEMEAFQVQYAIWTGPIRGTGIMPNPVIDVQKIIDACGQGLVGNGPFLASGLNNAPILGTLAGTATSTPVAGQPLPVYKYALLPLWAPKGGTVTIDPNTGAFTYAPNGTFYGYDRFFYSVSDGYNPPVVVEAIITVSSALAAIPVVPAATAANATPGLTIFPNSAYIDQPWQSLNFSVVASPANCVGSKYRISIKMDAADCDRIVATRIDCIDVTITKC
jgi:hypothetical protein